MHGRTIEEVIGGTYHLHGKTGNSGRKVKCFETFDLGSFRKQAMQFFPHYFKACSADLDILYLIFIARRSPTFFLFMHKISTGVRQTQTADLQTGR